MDAERFSFLLLLPCFACFMDAEETLVKTIWKESDFTPICTNGSSNIIILIVCKIRTERNNREGCSLRYMDEGDFVNECDSRFSLETRNQTVFLQLTSITAADSGNYSCQCSNLNGTVIVHLRITVNDSFPNNNSSDDSWSQSAATFPSALTAAVLLIFIVSVILGFIYRRRQHRACLRSETPGSSGRRSAAAIDEENTDGLYTGLQQPTADVYQTISSAQHHQENKTNSANSIVTDDLENLERNKICKIYENL